MDLYPDARNLVTKVAQRNVFTLVVTTSPRAWKATSAVFAGYSNIAIGLGLHPEVAVAKARERADLIASIKESRFIGEIGLDASIRFRSSLKLQESIFDEALAECSRHKGRILSLHSRGAASLVLDYVARYPAAGKVLLHWFSGTSAQLRRGISLGCWFSVGPAMLQSANGQALVGAMPLERILPETDGPFAKRAGRALMPWEAIEISSAIATAKGLHQEEVRAQFERNLQTLLANGFQR